MEEFISEYSSKYIHTDDLIIKLFDPLGVMDAEMEGVGFACGRGAIAAMLWAARQLGANQVNVLHYATSGDVSGDYEAVVGYGAAVIWQDHENGRSVGDCAGLG